MTRPFLPLSAALALALAACGGGPTSAGPTSTAPPSAPHLSTYTSEPTTPVTSNESAGARGAPAKRPTMPGPNATADGVVFNFKPETGKPQKVFLAGTFNEWKPDNPQYLMTDDGTGTWTITVKLPAGTYQYKYVADGKWIKDPYAPSDAPDGYGGRNGKFDVK